MIILPIVSVIFLFIPFKNIFLFSFTNNSPFKQFIFIKFTSLPMSISNFNSFVILALDSHIIWLFLISVVIL